MSEQNMPKEFIQWRDESPNQRYGNPVMEAWQAACASKQREIDEYRKEWMRIVEVMRAYIIKQRDYDYTLSENVTSAVVDELDKLQNEALYITPSEALAKHDAGLQAEIARLNPTHSELLAIHNVGMCIAECPPIQPEDTYTVRMVKEMAQRLASSHNEIARLNHQHANDEAANRILSDACEGQEVRIKELELRLGYR